MTDPWLRQGHHADLPEVKAIALAAYQPYVQRIGARPGPMDADYAAALHAGNVTVVEISSGIAAFLILRSQDDHMLLENIAVAPDYQGQGLGRKLICHAQAETRKKGFERILLYTHVKMTENIELYTRYGFVHIEDREEHGLLRRYMVKTL